MATSNTSGIRASHKVGTKHYVIFIKEKKKALCHGHTQAIMHFWVSQIKLIYQCATFCYLYY